MSWWLPLYELQEGGGGGTELIISLPRYLKKIKEITLSIFRVKLNLKKKKKQLKGPEFKEMPLEEGTWFIHFLPLTRKWLWTFGSCIPFLIKLYVHIYTSKFVIKINVRNHINGLIFNHITLSSLNLGMCSGELCLSVLEKVNNFHFFHFRKFRWFGGTYI